MDIDERTPRAVHARTKELVERLATGRSLAAVSAVLAFGFFLLGSAPGASGSAPAGVGDAGMVEGLDLSLDTAPADEGLFYTVYRVRKGDTISDIASRHDITVDSIVSFNGITNARTLSIGRCLKLPSMNGILYTTKDGDSAASLADRYEISDVRIADVNGLDDAGLEPGRVIFLPDARMSSIALREISGDLFAWPVRGWVTDWYGWRNDPFTHSRSFHTGIDIGIARGTPVRAAMEGVVTAAGYSTVTGNYVVIAHHSGYTTLYGHFDKISVKVGQSVSTATVIGLAGSTGYSTGPHVHFTVSKYGRTVNPMTLLR